MSARVLTPIWLMRLESIDSGYNYKPSSALVSPCITAEQTTECAKSLDQGILPFEYRVSRYPRCADCGAPVEKIDRIGRLRMHFQIWKLQYSLDNSQVEKNETDNVAEGGRRGPRERASSQKKESVCP